MINTKNTLLLCGSLATAAVLTLSSCGKTDSAAPAASGGSAAPAAPAGDLEEIKPEFPKPMFVGTPIPPGDVPNLEEPVGEDKVAKTFMAPKGTTNVAKGKVVTSSDSAPIIGELPLITDGDADSADGCFVELMPDPQWVQIDLEAKTDISKIIVWHFHKQGVIVKDFIVQVSDDVEFKNGVTTVYNADHDNTLKLGAGPDKAYVETNHGRMVDGKGAKGRYVRLYSNGSTMDDFNRYIEVSVYALPAK